MVINGPPQAGKSPISRVALAATERRWISFGSPQALAAHLLGVNAAALAAPGSPVVGPLVETFVVDELIRQAARLLGPAVSLYHYRTKDQAEADLIAEAADGRGIAIEVKVDRTVDHRTVRTLATLRDQADALIADQIRHRLVRGAAAADMPADEGLRRPTVVLLGGAGVGRRPAQVPVADGVEEADRALVHHQPPPEARPAPPANRAAHPSGNNIRLTQLLEFDPSRR